jgi:tRNA-splicing ligase RtcB
VAGKGITVMAKNLRALAEESSMAYKDVGDVVHVTHDAGISLKIAKMRPIGVIKG